MSPKLLPISTRGAGMATVIMYHQLSTCEYFFEAVPHICRIYRAVLGLLELQLAKVQENYNSDLREDDREMQYTVELPSNFEGVCTCPNPIAYLLNTVGYLEHETGNYVPAVHKKMYVNNRYVPRTDNILISNLRETVLALSNANTPLEYRKNFFKNNPIPGAMVENDLLVNPDEIIPDGYTLTNDHLGEDMNQIFPQVDEMQSHFNFWSVQDTPLGHDGHERMLYNSTQGDLAIPLRPKDQDLNTYYTQCLPTGNIVNFWSATALTQADDKIGPVNLLGELPNMPEFITPFYKLRDISQCQNPVNKQADYNAMCRNLFLPFSEDRARYGRNPYIPPEPIPTGPATMDPNYLSVVFYYFTRHFSRLPSLRNLRR